MKNTVIRLYDKFENADHARNALIGAGFAADDVDLAANEDEAGAMESNFYIGNGNSKDESYDGNYADAKFYSAYMLTVSVADDAGQARAAEIMDSFHATNVEQRTAGATASGATGNK